MTNLRDTELRADPLYAWLCEAIDMEDDPDQKLGLQRLRARLKLHWSTQRAWLQAARSALFGDLRSLRNRVEMHDAGPVYIVQSAPRITSFTHEEKLAALALSKPGASK